MSPTSDDMMKIAREELSPVLAGIGLRPSRHSRWLWSGRIEEGLLDVRLQMSTWSGDSPDGHQFIIELQLDRADTIGASARLFDLLTSEEREEHRKIQNLVIAKLPIDEAELDTLSPEWQADRLLRVAPRLAPYPPEQGLDVRFRYVDEDDIVRWFKFAGRVLPGAVDRLTTIHPHLDRDQLDADRARAAELGDPLRADDEDVRAADEAMRRIDK